MSSNISRGRLCAYVSEKLICCGEEGMHALRVVFERHY